MRGNLAQLCDSSNDWLKSVMTDDEEPVVAEQPQLPVAVTVEATLVMAEAVPESPFAPASASAPAPVPETPLTRTGDDQRLPSADLAEAFPLPCDDSVPSIDDSLPESRTVSDTITLPDIQARPSAIAARSAAGPLKSETHVGRRPTIFVRAKALVLEHRKLMIAGGLGYSLLIGGVMLAMRRPDEEVVIKPATDQTTNTDTSGTSKPELSIDTTPDDVPAADDTTIQVQPPTDVVPPANTPIGDGPAIDGGVPPQLPSDLVPVATDNVPPVQLPTDLVPVATDNVPPMQPPTDFVPVATDDIPPTQLPIDLVPVATDNVPPTQLPEDPSPLPVINNLPTPTETVAPVPPSAASAEIVRSMLGVATTSLEPITASGRTLHGGAMVTAVDADNSAPGDDLKLQLDDVITKVGDVEIHNQADLERALATASPKQVVKLEFRRYPRSWLREKLGVKPANAEEEAQRRRDVLLARALGENTQGFTRTLTIELTLGDMGPVAP